MTTTSTSGRTSDDLFPVLQAAQRAAFEAHQNSHLFTTNAQGLWEIYLASFPEGLQQEHNCHCCREFIRTFGGLVSIDPITGVQTPVMWPKGHDVPAIYRKAVDFLHHAVAKAKITGVFFAHPLSTEWGSKERGGFNHFAVPAATKCLSGNPVARAEKQEEFGMLNRTLSDYRPDHVATALEILKAVKAPNIEHLFGPLMWLEGVMTAPKGNRTNLRWLAVAQAKKGFAHIRSGMSGVLLDDIAAGKSAASIIASLTAKLSPLQYQRPQAAPDAGNLEQAEKLIEKLGYANSLKRRFATLEDVKLLWSPRQEPAPQVPGGVFSHLKAKGHETPRPLQIPEERITWATFRRDVLPGAENMEALTRANGPFAALLTAEDADAPNIMQWDNPVSWYVYVQGSDPRHWNIAENWTKVTGVTLQPTMWADENGFAHHGRSVFILLDDCRDKRYETSGLGLFPSLLRSELHPIRSAMEAYSKAGKPSGFAGASACGLRFEANGKMTVTVRVTKNGVARVYTLDRWE